MKKKKFKITTIGGGTGNYVLLSGLKNFPQLDLTAVVSVADSGGSSGRIRNEFGFLPVGDLRQCLAALTEEENVIRKMLLYRFSKGRGLKGHNLGNLILTALTDLFGSEAKAVERAGQIFRLKGKVFPVTTANLQLKATYEDGQVIVGEHHIDEPPHKGGKKIVKLEIIPSAVIYPPAKKAIMEADLIILGPGDLFTSILPNLLIRGVKRALKRTKAKIVFVMNLMTRYSQTAGFTTQDHLNVLVDYLGKFPDFILINKAKIENKVLKLYEKEKGFPVKDDLQEGKDFKIIRKNFLSPVLVKREKGDILLRSYLRHDPQKLAKTIVSLLK